jgi:hypothetical protein
MNARYGLSALACMAVSMGLMLSPAHTGAVETFAATTGTDKPAKGQKPKAAKAPKPASDKGSAEGRSERDKRLLRECRGRPNAGACEGFAS